MLVSKCQLDVINLYSDFDKRFSERTENIPDECFLNVLRHLWRHYNYAIELEDDADINNIGSDIDILIGEYIFRKQK